MKLEWKLDSHTMNWIGYGDGLEYHGVVECEKATFQEIHDAKIDNIARANGYVKLEPGQVVVRVADLKVLQGWASYGNWNPEGNGDGAAFERIAAALNDSGVEL